jgi:hypothetical protein
VRRGKVSGYWDYLSDGDIAYCNGVLERYQFTGTQVGNRQTLREPLAISQRRVVLKSSSSLPTLVHEIVIQPEISKSFASPDARLPRHMK